MDVGRWTMVVPHKRPSPKSRSNRPSTIVHRPPTTRLRMVNPKPLIECITLLNWS
jgi:hypothetical protein